MIFPFHLQEYGAQGTCETPAAEWIALQSNVFLIIKKGSRDGFKRSNPNNGCG